MGFVVGKTGTGISFSPSISVFPCQFNSTGGQLLGKYNNNKKKKLHHAVAQEALRLRCVVIVCRVVLLFQKYLNHFMGSYVVAFPSNVSTFCLLQAVSPSFIHRSIGNLCHTPTLEFH
jgi:hypothetical protein